MNYMINAWTRKKCFYLKNEHGGSNKSLKAGIDASKGDATNE
jgi:hypothetical protein